MAGASCSPFKVHNYVNLPSTPQIILPKTFPKNWEKIISEKIGAIKTQEEFPKLYRFWLQTHSSSLTEAERYEWLYCLYHYVKMDTNRNGIPDWTAIVDHQPSKILFPEDPDQDGDGIINVLDPDPLSSTIEKKISSDEIPKHLKIKRPDVAIIQEKIFKEFGIIAIDHTDEHSPVVLTELLSVLEKGISKGFALKNLRYIYAFASHDPLRNIASYHWQAQALSVGGIASYRDSTATEQNKIDLIAALSHEIGHAILFEKLTARNLADLAQKFAGWDPLSQSELSDSFFSAGFFKPYSFKQRKNIVSEYSMVNRHEWFAESFAGAILNRMGRKGFLGEGWRKLLEKKSIEPSGGYWVNYNNINLGFCDWFEKLMRK